MPMVSLGSALVVRCGSCQSQAEHGDVQQHREDREYQANGTRHQTSDGHALASGDSSIGILHPFPAQDYGRNTSEATAESERQNTTDQSGDRGACRQITRWLGHAGHRIRIAHAVLSFELTETRKVGGDDSDALGWSQSAAARERQETLARVENSGCQVTLADTVR